MYCHLYLLLNPGTVDEKRQVVKVGKTTNLKERMSKHKVYNYDQIISLHTIKNDLLLEVENEIKQNFDKYFEKIKPPGSQTYQNSEYYTGDIEEMDALFTNIINKFKQLKLPKNKEIIGGNDIKNNDDNKITKEIQNILDYKLDNQMFLNICDLNKDFENINDDLNKYILTESRKLQIKEEYDEKYLTIVFNKIKKKYKNEILDINFGFSDQEYEKINQNYLSKTHSLSRQLVLLNLLYNYIICMSKYKLTHSKIIKEVYEFKKVCYYNKKSYLELFYKNDYYRKITRSLYKYTNFSNNKKISDWGGEMLLEIGDIVLLKNEMFTISSKKLYQIKNITEKEYIIIDVNFPLNNINIGKEYTKKISMTTEPFDGLCYELKLNSC
jgi:hypothetical protein